MTFTNETEEVYKATELDAMGQLELIVGGLSATDPSREVFLTLKSLFERDFNLGVNGFNNYDTDAMTEAIKGKLNSKEVVKAFEKLYHIVDRYKKDKNSIVEVELDSISILDKNIEYDVRAVKSMKPITIEVVICSSNLTPVYYVLGKKIHDVGKGNIVDDIVNIYDTFTIQLCNGSIAKRKTWLRDELLKIGNTVDELILEEVNESTMFIEVNRCNTISMETLRECISIRDTNTGIILSLDRVIPKEAYSKRDVNNTFTIYTSNPLYKDKKYYKVTGQNTILSGLYQYTEEVDGTKLVHVTNNKTLEETNEDIIRLHHHIYNNKTEADAMASVFNDFIINTKKTKEEVDDETAKLDKREELLNKRERKMKGMDDLKIADAKKKVAEADKISVESKLLDSTTAMAELKAKNSAELLGIEILETRAKIEKAEKEAEKSSSDKDYNTIKIAAAAIGAGATLYSGYTILRSSGTSSLLGSGITKSLVRCLF